MSAAAGNAAYFNFTGGTLQAAVSTGGFISSNDITGVVAYQAGGTIDNNGFNIGITRGAGISAPTGNGITTIAVADGGSGYIGAPAVVITGANGDFGSCQHD